MLTESSEASLSNASKDLGFPLLPGPRGHHDNPGHHRFGLTWPACAPIAKKGGEPSKAEPGRTHTAALWGPFPGGKKPPVLTRRVRKKTAALKIARTTDLFTYSSDQNAVLKMST